MFLESPNHSLAELSILQGGMPHESTPQNTGLRRAQPTATRLGIPLTDVGVEEPEEESPQHPSARPGSDRRPPSGSQLEIQIPSFKSRQGYRAPSTAASTLSRVSSRAPSAAPSFRVGAEGGSRGSAAPADDGLEDLEAFVREGDNTAPEPQQTRSVHSGRAGTSKGPGTLQGAGMSFVDADCVS